MLNKTWFKKHLTQIKQKAGPRYTPELNVSLPISEIFDGVSRSEKFFIEIRIKYGELLREFKYVSSKYEKDELQKHYNIIKREIEILFKVIESIKEYNTNKIPWVKIQALSKHVEEHLWKFADELKTEKDLVKNIKTTSRKDGSYQQSPSERLGSDIHHIYKTNEIIHDFSSLSSSTKANLSNHPFLLLTGLAGTGKTHLLCDVIEQRIKDEQNIHPAILVFGEFFSDQDDFWSQLLEQLSLKKVFKTKETFLKKVDRLGKEKNCRSLIIVDALNENNTLAPRFWKKNLSTIVKEIRKYPNIALIVSIRTGFENEILYKKQKALFLEEEHQGFRFKEWEAVNKFFTSFSLPLPEVPLLMPEFQNPLFLLLFCKAFQKRKNKKNKQIFRGHEGATYIFENYIDSISKRIEKSFKIDHGKGKNIWDTVIERIAEEMVVHNDERIPESRLLNIIKKAHASIDSKKLVSALESNMLIVKVPSLSSEKERVKSFDIRFPFQKFSDHLIARYIFKKYEMEFGKKNKNLKTAKRFFSKRRRLGKFVSKTWNRGILEALSIQSPEQLKGIEFIEVAHYLIKENYLSQVATEAFVESLIWRNPIAFSSNNDNTLNIINKYVIRTESGHNYLLNALLSVTSIPGHPFNAEFLHKHLSRFSMPKRDSWWSTFLHYQHGEQGAVDRLLQWSWSDQDKSHIGDEAILLTAMSLAWFLTTPNRHVRDKATKGLVCLLHNRIHLIPKILKRFKDVNDPYIVERLFAVGYGCVLRNQKDNSNLKILAEWIYENIFKDNKPPVHILLRDYARGIIETALNRGIIIKIEKDNIRPPHESKWQKYIPSERKLKQKYYPEGSLSDKNKDRGFIDIWYSVMSFGDFARYVIGTNSWSSEWSGRKLNNPEPNRKNLFEEFKKLLSANQKELLEKATNHFFGIDISLMLKHFEIIDPNNYEKPSEEEIKRQEIKNKRKRHKAYIEFEESLQKTEKVYFKKEIKPYLDEHGNINDPFETFNLKIAQRWIFNRVTELGYDPKLHGKFDEMVNRYDQSGRSEHKAERIGKKYQWIAYHEFLALVSDHFEFKGDRWSSSKESYKGSWNPYIRDIDASFIIQNDDHIKRTTTFNKWIKNFGFYNAWNKKKSNLNWIKINDDLPSPKKIIQLNDDDNRKWLMLEGFLLWQEETPPELKKYDIPTREVWYMIKSYVVKKEDAKRFYNWLKSQHFMGRWMPESHSFYEVFLGEYPNSLAFEDLRDDHNIWTKSGRGAGDLPVPVVVTDDSYLNEFTLDCSYSGSISIKLPNKWIINEMNLYHKYLDGRFYDKNNNLMVITTSIFEESFPSALLINKNAFTTFLEKNGYTIFWTLLGEKQLIGGNRSREEYIGRLELSGSYSLSKYKKIIGSSRNRYKK